MQKRAVWILSLAGGVVLVALAVALVAYYKPHNTPEQNKKIEIQAVEEHDPAKCDAIKGNSYYFGGADAQITTSQTEARQQCRDNVRRGIVPPLIGI